MRTIIAGSRSINDIAEVNTAIELCGWLPTVVLSGTARGVDKLGETWAKNNSTPIEYYPAEWDKYGRQAGYKRNAIMASKADALVALWDMQSNGTKHMIDIAKAMKLKVFVYEVIYAGNG